MRLPGLNTSIVHAGEDPSDFHGALSVPIYQASVYAFSSADELAKIHEGEQPGYFYGRMGSPTQAAFEKAMAVVEGGEAALATASGMAAATTLLLTVCRPGDHLVAPTSLYTTTGALLHNFLEPMGIHVTRVPGDNPSAFEHALRPETRAIYLETPANPTLSLVDIEAVASIAKPRGVLTIVDSTFATPVNQRPLALGADAVVHSVTKYLGGHGDLVAGVIVGERELLRRARWNTAKVLGGVVAPHTAWLALRGLRTLGVRMERHNANALAVAEFLSGHPAVRSVHYPGLPAHPQHELARKQMRGFGGMVAFDVGNLETGHRVIEAVRLCSMGVSLGDVATLIQHAASMTQASMSANERGRAGVSDGLLRLSVGIEAVDDIIADLGAALETL